MRWNLLCVGSVAMMMGSFGSSLFMTHRQDASAFAAVLARSDHTDALQGPDIYRADDGLFYVDAHAGAQGVRFLIDTGATHVVLSHADAERLKGSVSAEGSDTIVTAGGHVKVVWLRIEQLEIRGRVLRDVLAAVPLRDTGISLLGQNALAQFSSMRIAGDAMTLGA